MDALTWPLFSVWLCFKVVQTEATSWTIDVPSSVKGLPGSCVVIPCSYSYPDPGKTVTKFTGIWTEETSEVIYHPLKPRIVQQYQDRTELLGDVMQKKCSLKIDPLQQTDQGPFHFRIEIKDYNNFSYKANTVSIKMVDKLNVTISVTEEIEEGHTALVSCTVSPTCPTSLPVFSWSHPGQTHFPSMLFDDGQWKATANLTFHPTSADHNKPLVCTVRYKEEQQQEMSVVLKVKHAPVNVMVEYKSDVKEGEAVQLKCSSDAHPASSYEWHNDNGVQLHQGHLYTLQNVSRHTGALYCTAINAVGQGKSSPVELSVLYAPEIKTISSSCSSDGDMVKCVCIVESNPPSMVHFLLSDGVLPGTKTEKHDTVTIGTLQAEIGSSEFVHCLANNTVGNASLVLSLPVNGKMENLYVAISIGAGVVLVILLMVGFAKKYRVKAGDMPAHHMTTMESNTAADPSHYSTTKRKEMDYDDAQYPDSHSNDHVYGNMESDWDHGIYANV